MNNGNGTLDFTTAVYDLNTGERLLAVSLTKIRESASMHAKGPGIEVTFRVNVDDVVSVLERPSGAELTSPHYYLSHLDLRESSRRCVTFYNELVFLRFWFYRDAKGRVSYDIQRGSYKRLYWWHREILGLRHGPDFADFNDQPNVSGLPFQLEVQQESNAA